MWYSHNIAHVEHAPPRGVKAPDRSPSRETVVLSLWSYTLCTYKGCIGNSLLYTGYFEVAVHVRLGVYTCLALEDSSDHSQPRVARPCFRRQLWRLLHSKGLPGSFLASRWLLLLCKNFHSLLGPPARFLRRMKGSLNPSSTDVRRVSEVAMAGKRTLAIFQSLQNTSRKHWLFF